jgi:hypothetical protein
MKFTKQEQKRIRMAAGMAIDWLDGLLYAHGVTSRTSTAGCRKDWLANVRRWQRDIAAFYRLIDKTRLE